MASSRYCISLAKYEAYPLFLFLGLLFSVPKVDDDSGLPSEEDDDVDGSCGIFSRARVDGK